MNWGRYLKASWLPFSSGNMISGRGKLFLRGCQFRSSLCLAVTAGSCHRPGSLSAPVCPAPNPASAKGNLRPPWGKGGIPQKRGSSRYHPPFRPYRGLTPPALHTRKALTVARRRKKGQRKAGEMQGYSALTSHHLCRTASLLILWN